MADVIAAMTAAGLPPPTDAQANQARVYGITTFEAMVGRKMLGTGTETYTYSPPTNTNRLDLEDLCSSEPVTVVYQPYGTPPVTLIAGQDYRLGPENAALRWTTALSDRPWEWLEFQRRWTSPYGWGTGASLRVTGVWGYSTTLPDDAWAAMLSLALLYLMPGAATAATGFLRAWREGPVSEEYGGGPGGAADPSSLASLQGQIAAAVNTYRKLVV